MTFVLGLTGGIATGKSTVSRYFNEKNIPVIDGDVIAREVVEVGTTGLAQIVETFGKRVLKETGELNRSLLGSIVFSDKEKLAQLNQILGLEIRSEIVKKITSYQLNAEELIVADIPLLFESGYEKMMDDVMVVYIPKEEQLKRLMARDNLTLKEAKERLESQWPIDEKKEKADILIDNLGSIETTYHQIDEWLGKKAFKS